jgi:hypothetical protein
MGLIEIITYYGAPVPKNAGYVSFLFLLLMMLFNGKAHLHGRDIVNQQVINNNNHNKLKIFLGFAV